MENNLKIKSFFDIEKLQATTKSIIKEIENIQVIESNLKKLGATITSIEFDFSKAYDSCFP